MLRQLVESFTTQTGSVRGDAKLLAGVICRRAIIALDLGGDKSFSRINDEARSMLNRVEDESCKRAECKLVFDALIKLQKDAVLLEIKQNLRNPVSEVMAQKMGIAKGNQVVGAGGIDSQKNYSTEFFMARRLFDQLQNNIEPFKEEEFPNLVEVLRRMDVPLSELRKEVFALWSFAFHLMLHNSAQKAQGNLAVISKCFDILCSDFVSVHREYGDGPEDFLNRRHRYAVSVSTHLNSPSAVGTKISEPILAVIFPVLMANASEDILYDDAATLRKAVDRAIELFLSLCSVCLEDLRKIKLID